MVQSMGYVFPLSLFERRIWAESREIIKQKLEHQAPTRCDWGSQ
jgi:hypothetical protein